MGTACFPALPQAYCNELRRRVRAPSEVSDCPLHIGGTTQTRSGSSDAERVPGVTYTCTGRLYDERTMVQNTPVRLKPWEPRDRIVDLGRPSPRRESGRAEAASFPPIK